MATYSRHSQRYAVPTQALPITMPSKAPAYDYPVSRVALSPPDYSDTASSSGRHSGRSYSAHSSTYALSHASDEYYSHRDAGVDVVDMLSERMDRAFNPIRMDKSLARQAQDSGRLNAKERELAELEALAKRRLKTARVNFAQSQEDAREIRRDLDYCKRKTDNMTEKVARRHGDAHSKAKSRSRHAA
ncbi:hypothetical protein DV736_g5427, partial [Chaetothyriales sp. CBS 134916]